jgi:hypothetical protein
MKYLPALMPGASSECSFNKPFCSLIRQGIPWLSAFIPFGWVYAFYHNVSVTGSEKSGR